MARAFWKGVLSFGMVVIPVKMYVATRSRPIRFHILHKKDKARLKQVWFCEHDEQYVSSEDTVRGYEYAKGQYVVMSDEDFEKVPVKTAHTIEIEGFVDAEDIDHIYYEDSHYLEPEEIGAKPFALLREVLSKTKRTGIAKVTFSRREHLCALRPLDDILALHTMYYHDEIVDYTEITPPKPKVTAAELEMATSLVKAMATEFRPESYKDQYQVALKKVIDAKLKGVEIKAPVEKKVKPAPDLMAALKASLEATKKKPEKKAVAAG